MRSRPKAAGSRTANRGARISRRRRDEDRSSRAGEALASMRLAPSIRRMAGPNSSRTVPGRLLWPAIAGSGPCFEVSTTNHLEPPKLTGLAGAQDRRRADFPGHGAAAQAANRHIGHVLLVDPVRARDDETAWHRVFSDARRSREFRFLVLTFVGQRQARPGVLPRGEPRGGWGHGPAGKGDRPPVPKRPRNGSARSEDDERRKTGEGLGRAFGREGPRLSPLNETGLRPGATPPWLSTVWISSHPDRN